MTVDEISTTVVPDEFRLGDEFVPRSRYHSREHERLEIDHPFPRTWLAACREELVETPGSYL